MLQPMKRLLPALLLAALPLLSEEQKEDPKAIAAADKLYAFLLKAEVPKEKAQDLSDDYEDFRMKSASEREKALREILSKPSFKGRPALVDMMKALNRMDMGPAVKSETTDRLKHARQENEDLQDKDPNGYEALLDDPSRRAAAIKRCGITKAEDIQAIEPYVFPGLEVRAAMKALGEALKAKGMDARDAAWVADASRAVWGTYYKPKTPGADDLAGLVPSGGEEGGSAPPPPKKKPGAGRRR